MATQPTLPNQTTARKWVSLNEVNNNIEVSIEELQVQVSAAQLLALRTTPVVIIPAGGQLGEVVMMECATLSYNFNTTAFTLNAGTLKLYYGPVANAHPITADLSAILTAAGTRKTVNIQPLAVGPDTNANISQQVIYLANDGAANYTLGDATLTVTIIYKRTTP